MEKLRSIKENEMIVEFLKAEIDSPRFKNKILESLKKNKKSKRIITNPKINNKKEDNYRKKLLGKVRGFGKNKRLFQNFPDDVKWEISIMNKSELKKVKYIDYSYWNKLSNKTRLPIEAVKTVKARIKIYGVGGEGFFELLSDIKKGKKHPKIILVAKNKKSRLVVLEGHARLTAYFLEPKYTPKKIEVIIGYSEKMHNWDLY